MNLLRFWLALVALALPLGAAEEGMVGEMGGDPFSAEVSFKNSSRVDAYVTLTSGSIWKTEDGNQYVNLCSAKMLVAAGSRSIVTLPVVALSSRAKWTAKEPILPVDAPDPRVAPLLPYLATHLDVPRETSQLVVLALTENINFANWQKFVATARPAPPAPASDVATALDALAILHKIAPKGDFALASDGALKLRALHDPILRGKALQLFGLTVPGDAPAGGVAPDLGQLLHTKPGDNCPICRMRAQMERSAEVP